MVEAGVSPDWWKTAKQRISIVDHTIAKVIEDREEPSLSSRGDLFATLIKSIVGQQISTKAAATVWGRLYDLLGSVTDESVLARTHEELRSVGLSNRKAEYVTGIAQAWRDGLQTKDWDSMSDEEVVESLIALRGVGRWTAEMILIFSLLRPDVFPIDDLGVVRGMEKVYNSGEPLSKAELKEIAEVWKPYRTLGSWYMWRAIDPEPVEY
tara:strand:- start:6044 stop:6673 length:630 start_codon:yes stop_codon:yes gene_type:complete